MAGFRARFRTSLPDLSPLRRRGEPASFATGSKARHHILRYLRAGIYGDQAALAFLRSQRTQVRGADGEPVNTHSAISQHGATQVPGCSRSARSSGSTARTRAPRPEP